MKIQTNYIGLSKDIIIDGNIMYENLRDSKLDESWLQEQLKAYNITDVEQVFMLLWIPKDIYTYLKNSQITKKSRGNMVLNKGI